MALAWLVALPLYLTGGRASPWFLPVSLLVMLTPGVAALVTVRFVEGERRVWTRLGVVTPGGSPARILGWAAVALGVCVAIVLVALPVGALLGVYPADFTGLSGLRVVVDEQLEAVGAPPLEVPVAALLVGQLVNVVIGAVINTVPALGEELGWRGYLFPRLLRLGTVPALVVSGVVWGVWHAPLGWSGWIVPAVLVAVLVVRGRLLPAPQVGPA